MRLNEREEKEKAQRLAGIGDLGRPLGIPDTAQEYCPRMGFEDALLHLKNGRRVTRRGWNGQGMFVFQGFPRVEVNEKPQPGAFVTAMDAAEAYRAHYAGPCFCLFTAQKTIQVGWLATQSDMLSDDWKLVE